MFADAVLDLLAMQDISAHWLLPVDTNRCSRDEMHLTRCMMLSNLHFKSTTQLTFVPMIDLPLSSLLLALWALT